MFTSTAQRRPRICRFRAPAPREGAPNSSSSRVVEWGQVVGVCATREQQQSDAPPNASMPWSYTLCCRLPHHGSRQVRRHARQTRETTRVCAYGQRTCSTDPMLTTISYLAQALREASCVDSRVLKLRRRTAPTSPHTPHPTTTLARAHPPQTRPSRRVVAWTSPSRAQGCVSSVGGTRSGQRSG